MSFGFSVGDCVLLLGIAKKQYQNCRAAGAEYIEIAREVKCLCGVLKLLRSETEKGGDSWLQLQDADATAELAGAMSGCRHILEDLQVVLAKYEGLSGDGEAVGLRRKISNRIGFGSKIQSLGEIRGKIITYTSTISVVLDAMQLKATGRLEDRMNVGFSQLQETFHSMRKGIVEEVLKARSAPKWKSAPSVLSLSTYAEDDKEIWQEFRRELVIRGFRSKQLDRHKDVLKAYMLKLEQNGILDELQLPESTDQEPWWTKHVFCRTADTLRNLQPIAEEHDHAAEPSEVEKEDEMAAPEGPGSQVSLTKSPPSEIDLPAVSPTSEPSGSSSTTTLVLSSHPEISSSIPTSVSPTARSPSISKLSLETDEDTNALPSQPAPSSIELDPIPLSLNQDHISIPENLETIPPTSESLQCAADTLTTPLPESPNAKIEESIIDKSQPNDNVRVSSEEIPDPAVEIAHETTLHPTEAELREALAALLNGTYSDHLPTNGTATTSDPKQDKPVVDSLSDPHALGNSSPGVQLLSPHPHKNKSKSTGAKDEASEKWPWRERTTEEQEAHEKRRRARREARRVAREQESSTSEEDKVYRRRRERTAEEQAAHDKRRRERREARRATQREREESSTSEEDKVYRRRRGRTAEEQAAHDKRRRERMEARRVAMEQEEASTSEDYKGKVERRRGGRISEEDEARQKRRRARREARRARREQEESSMTEEYTSDEYDETSTSEEYTSDEYDEMSTSEEYTSDEYDDTSTSEDYKEKVDRRRGARTTELEEAHDKRRRARREARRRARREREEASTPEDYEEKVDRRRRERTAEEEEAHQRRRREQREARRAAREASLSEKEEEKVYRRRGERTKSRVLPIMLFLVGGLAALGVSKDKGGGGKEKGGGGGKEKEPRSYAV